MTEKADHPSSEHRDSARAHSQPAAIVIHEVVRSQGEEEIQRGVGALATSGFAAGLSMGFSFLTMAFLHAHLPPAPWRPLVACAGYPMGFLIVVLGRQQLFTETTLSAILPALTRRTSEAGFGMLRVWAVVLVANLVGTWLFAWVLSHRGVFAEEVWTALQDLGAKADDLPLLPALLKAVMSGWLIALMVWLLPGAGAARILIIFLLTYTVALGQMPHIIAGSVETAFTVFTGQVSPGFYFGHFLLPTLVGNTAGGVLLTGLLNHAPIASELRQGRSDDEGEGKPEA